MTVPWYLSRRFEPSPTARDQAGITPLDGMDHAVDPEVIAHISWAVVASRLPGRTPKDCRKRLVYSLDTKLNKGAWTEEEDQLLLEAMSACGGLCGSCQGSHRIKWSSIARKIGTRSGDQASKRWREVLNPALNRASWSPDEDRSLVALIDSHTLHDDSTFHTQCEQVDSDSASKSQMCVRLDCSWNEIAKRHGTRTALQVRNRYLVLKQLKQAGSTASTGSLTTPSSDTSSLPASSTFTTISLDNHIGSCVDEVNATALPAQGFDFIPRLSSASYDDLSFRNAQQAAPGSRKNSVSTDCLPVMSQSLPATNHSAPWFAAPHADLEGNNRIDAPFSRQALPFHSISMGSESSTGCSTSPELARTSLSSGSTSVCGDGVEDFQFVEPVGDPANLTVSMGRAEDVGVLPSTALGLSVTLGEISGEVLSHDGISGSTINPAFWDDFSTLGSPTLSSNSTILFNDGTTVQRPEKMAGSVKCAVEKTSSATFFPPHVSSNENLSLANVCAISNPTDEKQPFDFGEAAGSFTMQSLRRLSDTQPASSMESAYPGTNSDNRRVNVFGGAFVL